MTAQWDPPGFGTAIFRALGRRCPRCGQRRIFDRWLSMRRECQRCGLRFEREEGYWLGAVALNLIVTEGLFIGFLVLGIVTTWPDVPWTGLMVVLVTINIATPILFHPLSRTLWLAIERGVRHWAEPGDA